MTIPQPPSPITVLLACLIAGAIIAGLFAAGYPQWGVAAIGALMCGIGALIVLVGVALFLLGVAS